MAQKNNEQTKFDTSLDLAEAARALAENARNLAEKARTIAEADRKDAEKLLAIAETTLEKSEEARKAAQFSQSQAEVLSNKKSLALANMSHELRTPLNAIIGYAEMLTTGMAGEVTEKQKKYTNNILISGQHLLALINDILDISKIEAGKIQLYPEKIELEPLFREVIGMVQEIALERKIQIHFEAQPSLNGMETDPVRLRQILLNLLSNAIKFNQEGGNINLCVSRSEDLQWIICEIVDTGIGIPTDKLSELFTEFHQIHTSPQLPSQAGTGLGLALTKQLLEAQGGNISVTSQEGVGTVFTFRLPVTPPPQFYKSNKLN